MKQKIYQVDAFASALFKGNPAAVCIMESWPSESLMQDIAMENNLSETAFLVKNKERYDIRWFTPEVEVDLCGHATLASAFVLFSYHEPKAEKLDLFSPRSGPLSVLRQTDGSLSLNFPADTIAQIDPIQELNQAMGITPQKTFKGKTDIMLIYGSQTEIEGLQPNFFLMKSLPVRGVIATAPGVDVDFVSRFFAPQSGVDEDPVTGSAHTSLTPFWAKELNKELLFAKQLSKRGGDLMCRMMGDRIELTGKAKLYLEGEINI
ncbi:MAG: PhzF family phenazine biosynthesis protein [Bacteroidia bacterium]|nr:PhzF family phenazine biosynthesis protein [Bacteroidia bacterium]